MKTYKLFNEIAGDSFAKMSDSDFERWVANQPASAEAARSQRKKAQERAKQAKEKAAPKEKEAPKGNAGGLVVRPKTQQSSGGSGGVTGGLGAKPRSANAPENSQRNNSGSAGTPRTSGRYRKGEEGWRKAGRYAVGDKYGDVFGKSKMKRKEALGKMGIDAVKGAAGWMANTAKDQWKKEQGHKVGVSKASPVA